MKDLWMRLHPVTYGRPLIRLGPDSDGGYLVPDDLEGIQACFSPGVNTIAGFETDCAERGMDVFMVDASINEPPARHPRFHFRRLFLGAITQGQFITLADWVQQEVGAERGDLLLQMDIEGYEYETLLSTPAEVLNRFRIIVVEFHRLDYLFSAHLFSLYSRAFERLLSTHVCVHLHPNNVCPPLTVGDFETLHLAEFTFVRKDRVASSEYCEAFPHALDRDNMPSATVKLPKILYGRP